MEINSKPRRKHKLKQGISSKSISNTTPPQSPFVSPLRFAKQKSILRISSPKATKSPLGISRMLPGSLPLDDDKKVDIPWDENDEEYPEVPKTPKPQHERLENDDDDDLESDGISSVSSGSKNGDIVRVPQDDDTDSGEEWEFKQFTGTEPTPPKKQSAGKKVGKLLGKHGRRILKGVRRRVSQENMQVPPPSSTSKSGGTSNSQPQPQQVESQQQLSQQLSKESSDSLQPQSSTSEKQQQQQQEPKPQKQRRIIQIRREPRQQPPKQQESQESSHQQSSVVVSKPTDETSQSQSLQARSSSQKMDETEEEPSSQSLQPPSQPQSAPPAPPARKQNILSPIRIKRRRKPSPQQPQSPDAESPRKAPRQVLKGKDREEAPPMRSDALWTQTIMTDDHNSDPEIEYNQDGNKIAVAAVVDKKEQQEEEQEEQEGLPKKEITDEAENTVRSDHLWAQNMMKTDQGHPLEDSVGLLTPEMMSPKTPTAAGSSSRAPVVTTTTTTTEASPRTLSQVPFSSDDDKENDDDDASSSSSKPDKMDASTGRSTHYTDTTANPTITPAGSESGRIIENSDLEDGNIVDEDDLLDLPSDEQDTILHEDNNDDDNVVQERDANTSDYYLRQVLSDDEEDEDEDDEGGVVSEHDEEEHLSSSIRPEAVDTDVLLLSDIPSHDSNSVLIDASDREEEDVTVEEFEMEVEDSHSGSRVSSSEKPPPTREVVGENLDTTISSSFTLDDSDLAEMEKNKESPAAIPIGQRSTLTNMQHRLLSMRTIKDTYKRKLVMQEQESVQLQVQLLASQYEAKEAKMSLQNAQAALLHEQAKLKASENERVHQKELLQNLQEQNAIVTAQLQKTNKDTKLPRDANSSFSGSQQSDQSNDMKLATMEEQLLVQDEEMDQLAAQIQELKHKTAELEAAKGVAEQKLKEALEREERLKTQLTNTTGQPMVDLELISDDAVKEDSSDKKEIQRLEELMQVNEVRYETESAALRKQLEDVQQQHELEVAKLQEQMEANKKLAESAAEEAKVARKKLLEELAVSKLEHSKAIKELKKSLSEAHQEEKSKLHTQYTTELERLEDKIEGSSSELSV